MSTAKRPSSSSKQQQQRGQQGQLSLSPELFGTRGGEFDAAVEASLASLSQLLGDRRERRCCCCCAERSWKQQTFLKSVGRLVFFPIETHSFDSNTQFG